MKNEYEDKNNEDYQEINNSQVQRLDKLKYEVGQEIGLNRSANNKKN